METDNIPAGTIRISLANVSQKIVLALFYVIVAKTNALTQADIGTLSILSFIAAIFSLLTLLDLPTALTKFVAEKLGKGKQEEAAGILKTVTRTVVILSVGGLAVVAFSSQLLSQYFWSSSEYALLVTLFIIYPFLSNLIALCNSSLQALHLFTKMAALTIILVISSRVVAIILTLMQLGVAGAVIGYTTGSFVTLIVAISFLRGELPKTTENMPLKPILKFSLPLFLSSVTLLISDWADILVITSLIGDYSLTGVYYIVIRSVATLSILWAPMITTIFPVLSARTGLKSPESISNILKTASRYFIYILFPSCLGLAIIAPTALTFIYDASYAKGAIPLAILSIGTIIIALRSLFITTLKAIGETGQILKINVTTAFLTVLMLVVLVPYFNVIGGAFARLAANVVGLILVTYLLRKEIRVHLDKEALWKSALASLATVPFLLAFELGLSAKLSTAQTLALEMLTSVAIYVLCLYILRAIKSQDFELLRQAFPKPLAKPLSVLERFVVRERE